MVLAYNFRLDVDAEEEAYLDACARVRGIAPGSLVRRMLKVICREQLVLSILDDDSKRDVQSGEHTYSEKRRRKRA